MKLTIYTVANSEYFDFLSVFIYSLLDKFPDEKLNKIIINDLGLTPEQRAKISRASDKIEYIKTSEDVSTKTLHSTEWRKAVAQKLIGLESLCKEENYPILMIDSDMYVVKDFSDEVFQDCDMQVCNQDPIVVNNAGHLIDHIGCWFIVHNKNGKRFVEAWRKRMLNISGGHVETPALCETLRAFRSYLPVKTNNINKIASMDWNENVKVVHFRTVQGNENDLSLRKRLDNVKNLSQDIKNDITDILFLINQDVLPATNILNTKNDRFDFGNNWEDYVKNVLNEKIINKHKENLLTLFKESDIKDKRILDIGCGSGLSSLCFSLLGGKVFSFDFDPQCVKVTNEVKEKFNKNADWKIQRGDILDEENLNSLGKFDLVYAWGSLHHTGKMWKAIENTISVRDENGLIMVTLYKAGSNYEHHFKLKKSYVNSSEEDRKFLLKKYLKETFNKDIEDGSLREPYDDRGMSIYNDAIDWLGGYPYEVAWPTDVIDFFNKRGLMLQFWKDSFEGGCVSYIFK